MLLMHPTGLGILIDSVFSLRMINVSEKYYVMLCSDHLSISQILGRLPGSAGSDGTDATLKNICKSRQVQVPLINYRRSNQI